MVRDQPGEGVSMRAGDLLAGVRDHIVILNVNEKVRRIVEELAIGSIPSAPHIVIMIQDRSLWESNPSWHPTAYPADRLFLVDGCPAEPADLEAVHIDRARAAVILADPRQGELADAHSTLVAVAIERRSPQVHTVMELIASVNRIHLRSTEVNEVVCLGELSERLIAQACVTPGIARVFADLLHAHPGTTQLFVCPLSPSLIGDSYRELARRCISQAAPFILCGFLRRSLQGSTLVMNPQAGVAPGRDSPLSEDDHLIVLAYSRPDLEAYL
jgi:voltage-gated potassium channel